MVTIQLEYPVLFLRRLDVVVTQQRADEIKAMSSQQRLDFLQSELDQYRPHPEPFGTEPSITVTQLGE